MYSKVDQITEIPNINKALFPIPHTQDSVSRPMKFSIFLKK